MFIVNNRIAQKSQNQQTLFDGKVCTGKGGGGTADWSGGDVKTEWKEGG